MTWKKLAVAVPIVLLAAACDAATSTPTDPVVGLSPQLSRAESNEGGRHHGALGVVYVSSQGLYYDTFVTAETLPPHGRFQKLDAGVTEFGPGSPGYLGGRWWVDVNGNDVQDEGDTYLLCPLLGPGRTTP